MLQSSLSRARRALGLVIVAACVQTGCSSGATSYAVAPIGAKSSASPGASSSTSPTPHASSTASVTATPTATATSQAMTQTTFPSKMLSGTVALPTGGSLTLSSLFATNSIGKTAVGANGAFALQTYSDGPQLTTIVDKNGSPVLMGWFGPSSTTIDVNSTASVLLFYATDSFALTSDLRNEATTLIPGTPGLGALANAVGNAIVSNPDSFALSSASVRAALQSLVTSLVQSSAATNARSARLHAILMGAPTLAALRKRMGVRIIAASTPTSGLTPIIDFPDGIHFLNELRRPADVFVDRVSYVDSSGATQSDPGSLTPNGPLAVAATAGVQGGTISTLIDIVNGTYAYSPVVSETEPLPLVTGSTSTLYQVTAVGPGGQDGQFSQIPGAYQQDGDSLSLKFMVTDFLLPLVLTQALPGVDVDKTLEMPGLENAIGDLVSTLATLPDIANAASSGDIGTALALAFNQIASSGTATTVALNSLVGVLIGSEDGAALETAEEGAETFLESVGVADRVEQAFDASVVYKQVRSANRADVYLVTVTGDKVTLSPPNQTIAAGFDGSLFAAVPDAGSSGAAFAYTYSNTAKFGHLFDGQTGHEDNFSSSSASVTYVANANVGTGGSDTVGVSVAAIDGSGRDVVNTANATVTVVPTPSSTPAMLSVSISPSGCTTLGNGGSITYTATASNVPANASLEYGWQFPTDGGGPTGGVTFTDPGATFETGLSEFVGPSNVVGIATAPVPNSGGFSNVSMRVQLFTLVNGMLSGGSAAAVAYFSYGQLQCPQ